MNKTLIEKQLYIPLTNFDLEKYIGKGRIVKYSEIDDFYHIDQLLPGKKDFKVILFETDKNSGHWIVLTKDESKNEYILFDSYGNSLGSHYRFNKADKNKELGNEKNALKKLLRTRRKGMRIVSNKNRFQSVADSTETCGYWVLLFLNFYLDKNYNLKQFEKWIDKFKDSKMFKSRDFVPVYLINKNKI